MDSPTLYLITLRPWVLRAVRVEEVAALTKPSRRIRSRANGTAAEALGMATSATDNALSAASPAIVREGSAKPSAAIEASIRAG